MSGLELDGGLFIMCICTSRDSRAKKERWLRLLVYFTLCTSTAPTFGGEEVLRRAFHIPLKNLVGLSVPLQRYSEMLINQGASLVIRTQYDI